MRLILSLACAFCVSTSAQASQAYQWLERLSDSIQQLNFNTSFVVVQNNSAEPYRWLHGRDEDGTELEILSLLNGPRRDVARKDGIVSYIEPNIAPYSVLSSAISGPIPAAFSGDVSALAVSYNFIPIGRSRILGRVAQGVRIVSKDQNRYAHWLWLDEESGLLLKSALATKQGQILEQIQFTHLEITDQITDALVQLKQASLPAVVEVPSSTGSNAFNWQVSWMPIGFKAVKQSRHGLAGGGQLVEFLLYNDGLVDVSVYVSPSSIEQKNVEYVHNGATVVLTVTRQQKEISVVGKIPAATAKAIADSIIFDRDKP